LNASVLRVVAVESHLGGRNLWDDILDLVPALVLYGWEVDFDCAVFFPLIKLRIGHHGYDDLLWITAWTVVC